METKLQQFRQQKKLSRRELSELSGVSQYIIEKIEHGKRNTTIDKKLKLANALKVNPTELFDINPNELDIFYSKEIDALKDLDSANDSENDFYEAIKDLMYSRAGIENKDKHLFEQINPGLIELLKSVTSILESLSNNPQKTEDNYYRSIGALNKLCLHSQP